MDSVLPASGSWDQTPTARVGRQHLDSSPESSPEPPIPAFQVTIRLLSDFQSVLPRSLCVVLEFCLPSLRNGR